MILFILLTGLLAAGRSLRNRPTQALLSGPVTERVAVGSELSLPIRINTSTATINAAELFLSYDPTELRVLSVDKADSIFSIWITDQPSFDQAKGAVSFAGGLPNPGFSGQGVIGQIRVQPLKKGPLHITFSQKSRILLNDGQGTALRYQAAPITIEAR